ncbi:hypothetical protein BH20ACT6_BH20ACT6_14460 [soil metagenome]
MPTPTKGTRLGGSPAHQRLMLANLATSLFEYGKITTTEAKARRLRPFAERLISKARRDDLHHRRQVLRIIRDKSVVHALFTEIGPNYSTRPGGYTRITKLGPRKGDNAPMAVIELVEAREFATTSTRPVTTATTTPPPAPTEESEPVEEDARDEEAVELVEGSDETSSVDDASMAETADVDEASDDEASDDQASDDEAAGDDAKA